MAADLIQLSDRRRGDETRMEAIAFLDETEMAARALRVHVFRGDRKGVLRVADRLQRMVDVGREECDRLTLRYGGPDAA